MSNKDRADVPPSA